MFQTPSGLVIILAHPAAPLAAGVYQFTLLVTSLLVQLSPYPSWERKQVPTKLRWFFECGQQVIECDTLLTCLIGLVSASLLLLTVIWYSITHSLFLSRLKSFLFCKSFQLQPFLSSTKIFTTWIPQTVYCYF